nr:hypothetical protein [Tanacetum cinerariifolium]
QNGVVERRNQTLVEAARTIKLDISFLHVSGALCYPKNDREDIGKLGAKGEVDLLFEAMYDDYIGDQPSTTVRTVPAAQEPQDVDELNLQQQRLQQQGNQPHLQSKTVADNIPNALFDGNTFVNPFAIPSISAAESSSSHNVDPSNMHTFYQPYPHEFKWTKDHPLEQVIGEPSRPVLTRNQLRFDGDMCMYALTMNTMEPKNVKEAAPKPKASARKKKGGSASSTAPPTPIATPTPTTTVVAAPRLSAATKGKQPARATTPTEPTDVKRTEAEQLKIILRRSRQEMHISQQCGSGTDEGTGSRPGVPDVPSDDSEEELSWKSSDDEDVDEQTKGRDESEGDMTDESDDDDDDQDEAEKVNDDDDDEEEITKIGKQEVTKSDEDLSRGVCRHIYKIDYLVCTNFLLHRTMATTIEQQVALDEAFVPSTQREMLHISPRVLGQSFAELPFKEEILEFLRFLGHSAQIKTLTDGLYHRRNVDYAFLIWEDFVYQVEHKNQKKSNKIYYPRFTKVIIHHFTTKKPSIPRRNKVNWHYVRDDILFSTIKVVSRHQNTQQYGAILPIELTTEDIRNTKAYKEYYACATREAAPKPKASARRKRGGYASSITPSTPIATPTPITTVVAALRLTAAAKGKQPTRATSPTDPSDVERTEAEQLKIVLRRSRQETHISQQGSSSTDEGTGSKPGVPDGRDDKEGEKTDESDDDQDKAEKVKDDDDDKEEISKIDKQEATESGEGDDEETKSDGESEDEEIREKEEESFDPIPKTPEESEDDGNGEKDQGLRISEEERMHEEEEEDELYRDIDINQGMGLQVSQDIEDSHVTLTQVHSDGQQESSSTSSFMTSLLNPIIDPGMESIFTTGSSSVTLIPSPKSIMTPSIITTTTTSSQPPIPPTPIPSDILQTLPTFTLVFRFEDRVKSLEVNFSDSCGQTSLQKPSLLSRALVEAYDADKTILDSYRESAILKRRREDDDDQEGPSARSNRGSKRRREGGEHASASTPSEPATTSAGRSTTGTQSRQMSASESAFAEEPVQTTCQMDEPSHPVFETGAVDQPIVQTSQHPEWFSQPRIPPTPNHDWNKNLPAVQRNAQSWISALAKQTDARSSFNKLLDTPIDFSNFIMNRLDVDTLTPKLLAGPTYELMRGSCNSLTELEYHLEEVYKATTDQLDWDNPEGQQYPHNLLQPLPLIPDNRGRRVIPFAHFINNDLEYLRGGASSRKYTTYVTKTKAADYGHIKWIEDLVPRTMWIQEPLNYDKHALWGVSHWGRKCQQFYGFTINRESALDVYFKRRIIAVTDLKIVERHNYKHLDWISLCHSTILSSVTAMILLLEFGDNNDPSEKLPKGRACHSLSAPVTTSHGAPSLQSI